jgi:5-methylcytosine-specific restriction endonuclease McrA
MFHPGDVPCRLACFEKNLDCPTAKTCQYRWAVLQSLWAKHRVARRRWVQAHPEDELFEANNIKYKDIVDLLKVYLKAGFFCWYCLEPMVISHGFGDKQQMHVHHVNDFSLEHKIPLSKGGTNELSNLAFCCIGCNNRVNESTMPSLARTHYRRVSPTKSLTVGDVYTVKKGTRSACSGNDDNNWAGTR